MTSAKITKEKEHEIEDEVNQETEVLEPEEHYTVKMASIVRAASYEDEEGVPLWLITFTDVMALMLTFFVLLYSMSVPQEDKWEEITSALNFKLGDYTGSAYNAGSQDVINIDRISTSKALDLRYLKTLLVDTVSKQGKEGEIFIFQNNDRLVVSLPTEVLFESGSAQMAREGKKMLFTLGGVLDRIKNRIEIVGHTDPDPITGSNAQYRTNWELSLARANALAAVLREVGYTHDVTVKGQSSARFDEMDSSAGRDVRYELSRRVDLIIMNDDGFRYNAFEP